MLKRTEQQKEQAGAVAKPVESQRARRGSEQRSLADVAGNQAVSALVEGKTHTMHQAGERLDPALATFLSHQLGADVTGTHIHRDSTSEAVTADHGAAAVTHGKDIYLASDVPALNSPEGIGIATHEAVHVAQNVRGVRKPPSAASSLETEAATATEQLGTGRAAPVQGAASAGMTLTLTKEDRKRRGKIGAIIGGVLGVAAGIAIIAYGGPALGPILGALGAVVGGAGLGALIGYFRRRTKPVGIEESDKLIQGRYGKNLQAQIAAGISAEKSNINVVDDKAFKVAYQAAGKDMDDYELVGGFVDRSTNPPTVWIHKDRQKTLTVLHEAVHLYSNPALRTDPVVVNTMQKGNMVNEGFTHYFTEEIADEQHLDKSGISTDYVEAAAEVRALGELVGEDMLRQAYFEGDVAGLRAAFDAKHGADAFDAWITAVNSRNWSLARRIVKQGKP